MKCKAIGCEKPIKIKVRGLCKRHSDRFYRYKDPNERIKKKDINCKYCEKKSIGRGMCKFHYSQWYRNLAK